MKRLLYLIFILALIARLYKLADIPVGFHADEVRVGWNTYSILKTGRDDKGNSLALYYNTFGDYRPTGIFYITIPSIAIFGLSEFSVRLPSAILGALTVFSVYYLALELTRQKLISYLSAFFLALSPWHISASRGTSEVVISMFFATCALVLLFRAIAKKQKYGFTWSVFLFYISYLFYHSIRLLAPLFVLVIFIVHFKKSSNAIRSKMFFSLLAISFLTFILTSTSSGRGRLSQVSILHSNEAVLSARTSTFIFDSPVFIYAKNFIGEYSKYFSGEFLVGDSSRPIRYKTPDMGVATYVELVLLLAGAYLVIRGRANPLILILFLMSPIPAALTREDAPNIHRALFMMIYLPVLAGVGGIFLYRYKKLILALFLIFNFIQIGFFWRNYSRQAKYLNGQARNFGAKSLVLYLNEMSKNYEKVYITNDPDDPYAWYAFYTKKEPFEFNSYATKRLAGEWEYQNLLFTQKECPSGDVFPDKYEKAIGQNVLVVDGFKCAVESKLNDGMQAVIHKQFFNPDGSVAYTLWEKK